MDGPGLRFAVFAQGCEFNCDGCHNPHAREPDGGTEMTVEEIVAEMARNPLTDGLTLTGGEPLLQAADSAALAAAAKERGLNVWVYSGYTFEEIADRAVSDSAVKALLESTDVLIDGRFVLKERSLSIKWRGSRNQRAVDVKKSIAAGKAIEYS